MSDGIGPLGDSALLGGVREQLRDAPGSTLDEVLRVFQCFNTQNSGRDELAPAYTSVAVFFDPSSSSSRMAQRMGCLTKLAKRIQERDYSLLSGAIGAAPQRVFPRLLEIPVCYDPEFGFDLGSRGPNHTKLSERQIIDLHSTSEIPSGLHWFVPGFNISGRVTEEFGDAAPRRYRAKNSCRFGWHRRCATGIYPLRSPGGWNFDRFALRFSFSIRLRSADLLCPGDRVRFRAITREEFVAFAEGRQRITRDPSLRSG